MFVNLMKGGPYGPAITTSGAAFAALGSFLAHGVAVQCTHVQRSGVTHRLTD
ncbi:hypothetical protein PF008_g1776 [Phytophthora fragariae]|uniref:Uncharacterized protein n=1 Tax=Phytophthora fragariae TaxID=53985 RepID=A0A6G0SL29_9STRA|nr:hypothetical protein PF008_g1776 [Phytophthora fragariae]